MVGTRLTEGVVGTTLKDEDTLAHDSVFLCSGILGRGGTLMAKFSHSHTRGRLFIPLGFWPIPLTDIRVTGKVRSFGTCGIGAHR